MYRNREYIQRALKSFEGTDDKRLMGTVQLNLAVAYGILGCYDEALTYFQRARSHFEEVGDLARLAELHYQLGMVLLVRGAIPESEQEFDTSAAFSAKSAKKHLIGLAHLGKAHAYFEREDIPTAFMLAEQAQECFSPSNDRAYLAEVYKLKGMIRREQQQFELALWYLYTSLRVQLELGNTASVGSCYFELGKLYVARRKRGEARRAFKKSLRCFQHAGVRSNIARAAHELHELKVLRGTINEIRRARPNKIGGRTGAREG